MREGGIERERAARWREGEWREGGGGERGNKEKGDEQEEGYRFDSINLCSTAVGT